MLGFGTSMAPTQVATTLEARAADLIAATNAHDVDRLVAFAADDIAWVDPISGSVKGADALRRALQDWFAQFADTTYTVRTTITSGNIVGLYYHASAKVGGRRIDWQGAFSLTFNGQGKVQAGFEIFDADELSRQVGR